MQLYFLLYRYSATGKVVLCFDSRKSNFGKFWIPINVQVQQLNSMCILAWERQPVCPNLALVHF